MNIFEKFLVFLQGEMVRPSSYGWFHIMWLIIAIAVTIFIVKRKEKDHEKSLKYILGIYGIVAFLLELLKQLIWSFNYDPSLGIGTWDYTWYSAPFQLCTTPVYVSLICLFLKPSKFRNTLLSYLAFTTILGSVATAIYPETCFVKTILINIHTMYLHFGSLVVSVYLLCREVEIDFKNYLKSYYVFVVMALFALLLDVVVYQSGILNGETFNMFFISPYFPCTLPILELIYPKLPYLLFLLFYFIIIFIGGLLIYLIANRVEHIIIAHRK